MPELSQPHDRFFGKVFSQMETVESILTSNVPPLAKLIVSGTLEDCREKLVNPELEKFYSDLLLKTKLKDGSDVYIYILLEHKSYHEPSVSFDLTRYMMNKWEKLRDTNKSLPFIFPIVIYHGKQKWSSDTNFATLVNIPEGMEEYVPHFNYYLFDLSQYSDEEIKGTILSRVILSLMKHIYDENFGEQFLKICRLLSELKDEKTALEFMRSVLEYVGNATDKITKEQVQEGVKLALPQVGEELMPTLFEQLKEEGRKEGIEKGIEKGRKEGVCLALLEVKYGSEGLAFFNRMKELASFDDLNRIEEAIRNDASLSEIEKLIQ